MRPSLDECEQDGLSAEPLLERTETFTPVPPPRKPYRVIIFVILMLIVGSLFLWAPRSDADMMCRRPEIRREWRMLSSQERKEYIRAVKCLSSIPSTLSNGTLHDEFAFIHSKIGGYSHEAAPFLPWHRYFIHIYEKTLKSRCNYKGTLPYWDWIQDWMNLTQAPVWDATEGFGGNGEESTPVTVGHGHCIQSGPFARLQVQYYNEKWSPHCLSRGFLTGDLLDHFGAQRLNSSAISAVLDETDYYSFVLKLEDGPHSAIPITVRGDFSRFTAPNDPIFFLHHGQIDRLWWKWQRRDLEARIQAYNGPSSHDSSVAADLSDLIEMAELAPSIPVSLAMTTNNEFFCYRYES